MQKIYHIRKNNLDIYKGMSHLLFDKGTLLHSDSLCTKQSKDMQECMTLCKLNLEINNTERLYKVIYSTEYFVCMSFFLVLYYFAHIMGTFLSDRQK